jgi:hypothetical protein
MNVLSPMPRSLAGSTRTVAQPALGLLGLLLVVPLAALFAVGAGAERSTLVLAPLITYSLPLVAMVGFWWGDWPGVRWRPRWSGWIDTALIATGAIILTGMGQAAVAGRPDPVSIFDPAAGPGDVPTFPATLTLAGTAFVAMLQITLVGERWPLHRLPWMPAGLLAVAFSWGVAVVVYFTIVRVDPPAVSAVAARDGPVGAADFGAALVLIAAWQVVPYVVWRSWPFSTITPSRRRLPVAHFTVLVGGLLSYLLAHVLIGVPPTAVAAAGGCFIAAALVLGMLFDGWLPGRLAGRGHRTGLLIATTCLAALLAVVLYAAAGAMHFARATAGDWVEHASLNALSASIILHVAIGRRWPFGFPVSGPSGARAGLRRPGTGMLDP